jgi:L,D-peptidoglycan transpeptidase YkuD (ErfK/YbiS/YcfS/YnhG family)
MKLIINKMIILTLLITVIFKDKCESKDSSEYMMGSEISGIYTRVVSVPELNVREKPRIDSPVLFKLYYNMKYLPIGEKNTGKIHWFKIKVDEIFYWVEYDNSDEFIAETEKTYKFKYKLEVLKAERKMWLMKKNGAKWSVFREYIIALGQKSDERPKYREGDCRTPTGKYYICKINPSSSYGKDPENGNPLPSLMISYPNQFDAWKGLQSGRIEIKTYNSICVSIDNGKAPPQGTPLGSYVMIHGGGNEYDWTLGCIALSNGDMKELTDYAKTGMLIEIR